MMENVWKLIGYLIWLLTSLLFWLADVIQALVKFIKDLFARKRATHIAVFRDGKRIEEGQMDEPLSNTDIRRLSLVPEDDQAKRDSIQAGTMKAMSEDESVATIALDPADELQALITPVDGASSPEAKFRFTADADLGEGVAEISGEYSCPIVDKMATVIKVTKIEDTPKP